MAANSVGQVDEKRRGKRLVSGTLLQTIDCLFLI